MNRFRALVAVILISGTAAGLLLFLLQHVAVYPLIERAEVYESAAEQQHAHAHESHEKAEWTPANGAERTLFTAAGTILTGIGFAALLFGLAAVKPVSLDWRKGILCGLAAFACVNLAPALGLPPVPPGVDTGDLYMRQIWWTFTAGSTAAGLWLVFAAKHNDRQKEWTLRCAGCCALLLPHAVGPHAISSLAIGAHASATPGPTPPELVRQFAIASLLTTGIFWIALGSIGGLLYGRSGYADASDHGNRGLPVPETMC